MSSNSINIQKQKKRREDEDYSSISSLSPGFVVVSSEDEDDDGYSATATFTESITTAFAAADKVKKEELTAAITGSPPSGQQNNHATTVQEEEVTCTTTAFTTIQKQPETEDLITGGVDCQEGRLTSHRGTNTDGYGQQQGVSRTTNTISPAEVAAAPNNNKVVTGGASTSGASSANANRGDSSPKSSTSEKKKKKKVPVSSNNSDKTSELYLKLHIVSQGGAGVTPVLPPPRASTTTSIQGGITVKPPSASTIHVAAPAPFTSSGRVDERYPKCSPHRIFTDDLGDPFCVECGKTSFTRGFSGANNKKYYAAKKNQQSYRVHNKNNKQARNGFDDRISPILGRFAVTWVLPPLFIVICFIISDYVMSLINDH